jgi:molybdate transport system permease protein
MSGEALLLSLRLACTVSVMLLVIALPMAYWLAFSAWRGKFLLESVVALPLVLPPTVLGFYALIALGPRGMLGKLWQGMFGRPLAFTFKGLVLASMLYSLPFAVQPLVSSFESLDRRLLDASSMLGAGRARCFFRIVLPLAWPGVITAVVLSFAHTLGEFGVVLMVGGNIPGVTRTVSISVYDSVQALDYASAGTTSCALLIASFMILCAVYAINRKGWRVGTAVH